MLVKTSDIVLLTLKIVGSNDIVLARQRARQITALLNFDLANQTKISTVVSEIARNTYQYAGEGKIEFCIKQEGPNPAFVVKVSDKGPGITNLNKILAGEYISATSSSLGIIGSKRIMDEFTIHTSQHGTEVIASMYLPLKTSLIVPAFLTKISDELARHRPSSALEEVHYQNQELLKALDSLSRAHNELEDRVNERTEQLAITNEQLKHEILEREQLEGWLQQHRQNLATAERINSMGEMASALAHELNQPLAAITSYIQGCLRRLKNNDFQKDQFIDVMEKTAQQSIRAGEIIHRMKDFARKGKLSTEITIINKLIQETIIIIQNELEKHQVVINFDLCHELPPVVIDTIQMQQAIINLLRNAIQAMKDANVTNPQINIVTGMTEDHYIEIKVIDNGPGLKVEDTESIFAPYFTTKKSGMGMGLSISKTIAEAHGGKLLAKNNQHGGAIFYIQIPVGGKIKQ